MFDFGEQIAFVIFDQLFGLGLKLLDPGVDLGGFGDVQRGGQNDGRPQIRVIFVRMIEGAAGGYLDGCDSHGGILFLCGRICNGTERGTFSIR